MAVMAVLVVVAVRAVDHPSDSFRDGLLKQSRGREATPARFFMHAANRGRDYALHVGKDIVKPLIEAIFEQSMTHRTGQVPAPALDAVHTLITHLRALMFPGFQGPRSAESKELEEHVDPLALGDPSRTRDAVPHRISLLACDGRDRRPA